MWKGILGMSDVALPAPAFGGESNPTSPIINATSDVLELVTIHIRSQRTDGRAPQAGERVECVADIEFGTAGVTNRLTVDLLRGVTLSLGATFVRVSARNRGNVEQKVLAHVAPGARPTAREAQLTTLGEPLLGGAFRSIDIPAFAVWMEIWRTAERTTELEIDMLPPTPAAALFNVRAALGERMPRMPVANGATRALLRNTAAGTGEALDPVAIANALTPTIIWGLCV